MIFRYHFGPPLIQKRFCDSVVASVFQVKLQRCSSFQFHDRYQSMHQVVMRVHCCCLLSTRFVVVVLLSLLLLNVSLLVFFEPVFVVVEYHACLLRLLLLLNVSLVFFEPVLSTTFRRNRRVVITQRFPVVVASPRSFYVFPRLGDDFSYGYCLLLL